MTERELLDWLRPQEILWEEEIRAGGLPRLVELYRQTLAQFGEDPSVVQILAARRIAESVWKFDRLTGDGPEQKTAKRSGSRTIARAEHFAEAEARARLTRLLREDIEDIKHFAAACGDVVWPVKVTALREVG